ncbi:hypothetical protein STEG23_009472, partial [Scotinomys teguina]
YLIVDITERFWSFSLDIDVSYDCHALGRDQDCNLKNREPDVPAPWFLDPGGWSKTATVRLFFIFPGICTLSPVILYPSVVFDAVED